MTGDAGEEGTTSPGAHANSTPARVFRLETLKQRRAFREAAGGRRYSTPAFTLLRRPVASEPAGVRFGFTVTKKLGNAVVRNRIKRRLREAVRIAGPGFADETMDLVILARKEARSLGFAAMVADIVRAVSVLAGPSSGKKGANRGSGAVPSPTGNPSRHAENPEVAEARLGKPAPLGIEGG